MCSLIGKWLCEEVWTQVWVADVSGSYRKDLWNVSSPAAILLTEKDTLYCETCLELSGLLQEVLPRHTTSTFKQFWWCNSTFHSYWSFVVHIVTNKSYVFVSVRFASCLGVQWGVKLNMGDMYWMQGTVGEQGQLGKWRTVEPLSDFVFRKNFAR